MKQEILRLKKEKKAVILAHNYQLPEIQDIADFTGDSLELARKAADLKEFSLVVFCGVRFMAETAKILSPEKKVVLPDLDAGCPLADTITVEDVADLRRKHPDAWVVSYVNTNADVKALTDVCCTSSNAVAVVRNVPVKTVLFLPDGNLCWYVRQQVPDKDIICWDGYCYVHRRFTQADVSRSRVLHPAAEIMAHPECAPEVQKLADGVYSTSGMLKRAGESAARCFIVATEEGMLYRLKKEHPGKEFYSLGAARLCVNMKKTTLAKVKRALENEAPEITVPDDVAAKARKSLERMIEYA